METKMKVKQQHRDMHDIRRSNLETLMERFKEWVWARFPSEPERGMMTRFSNTCGVSPRYMSHIRNGRKEIGTKTARDIEAGVRGLGKEFADIVDNWMDNDHELLIACNAAEKGLLLSFRAMPEKAQEAVNKALMEALEGRYADNDSDDKE